jgi:FkbM family methyltransferase
MTKSHTEATSMKRVFIDVGRFDGVAILQYCVDDSWDIYSFDPNPQPDLDLPEHELIQAAVWTDYGYMDFALDPLKQASHLKGIAGTEYEDVVTVPTIDFSDWITRFPEDTEIICSFDAEGAEFSVLRKMIKDGTAQRIKVLDVEFHHRMMNDEDDESARKLVQELSDLGVIVRLKIVLNK